MSYTSRLIAATLVVPALLTTGCTDRGISPTGVAPPDAPRFLISDATTAGGRDGFYFVPPTVSNPGPFTGTFDAGLSPEVRICALVPEKSGDSGGFGCGTVLKTLSGSGKDGVKVDVKKGTYSAQWQTKGTALDIGPSKYRVEVWVGAIRVGFADLWVVASSKDLQSVTPGYVGVVAGSPLAIAFRIETRTIGTVALSPASSSILFPETQGYTAEVRDLHGNLVPNPSIAWSSLRTTVATVSPASGASTTASAVSFGTAWIQGTVGGVTARAHLTVTLPGLTFNYLNPYFSAITVQRLTPYPKSSWVIAGVSQPIYQSSNQIGVIEVLPGGQTLSWDIAPPIGTPAADPTMTLVRCPLTVVCNLGSAITLQFTLTDEFDNITTVPVTLLLEMPSYIPFPFDPAGIPPIYDTGIGASDGTTIVPFNTPLTVTAAQNVNTSTGTFELVVSIPLDGGGSTSVNLAMSGPSSAINAVQGVVTNLRVSVQESSTTSAGTLTSAQITTTTAPTSTSVGTVSSATVTP